MGQRAQRQASLPFEVVVHVQFNDEFGLLRLALRNIAADADAQIERFELLKVDSDDLALTLDHAYRVARKFLTPDQDRAIAALDDLFSRVTASKKPELWDDDALRAGTEWAEARVLATEALRLLPDGPSARERRIS